MKKFFTATVLISTVSLANASDVEPGATSYSIALDRYKESRTFYWPSNNNIEVLKDSATMGGIKASTSFQATDSVRFNIRGRYAIGNPKFDNSTIFGPFGSSIVKDHDRRVWELGAEYKQTYEELNDLNVGVGFNYRQLTDSLHVLIWGNSDFVSRVHSTSYAIVSMDKEFSIGSWGITPRLAGEVLLEGTQKHTLNSQYGIRNKQNKGRGYSLEVNFAKEVNGSVLSIAPYVRSMTIENSDTIMFTYGMNDYLYTEPKNKTVEAGLSVGLNF